MNQIAAGWYADPEDPTGNQLRYWNGQMWTQHTQPRPPEVAQQVPQGPQQQIHPQQVHPQVPQYGQSLQQPQHYGAPQYAPVPGMVWTPTTPDGVPLASWGVRLGAYLLDGLIMVAVALVVAIPFGIYGIYVDAFNAGIEGESSIAFNSDEALALIAFSITTSLINMVYSVAFWVTKGATPGKMVLGLKVRLRDQPGNLTIGVAILRWFGQSWYMFLAELPGGSFLSLYGLLDGLWPLWDSKNQALHDKIAKTNVVRVR